MLSRLHTRTYSYGGTDINTDPDTYGVIVSGTDPYTGADVYAIDVAFSDTDAYRDYGPEPDDYDGYIDWLACNEPGVAAVQHWHDKRDSHSEDDAGGNGDQP